MDKQLDFYQVDAQYIAYLLKHDNRVPKVDYSAENAHEKFLCGVVLKVHDHDYFAPISSFRTQQRSNMIIKKPWLFGERRVFSVLGQMLNF